jgi:hypothetical protein
MAPHAALDVGEDGVAIITLTNPPVNALHPKCKAPLYKIQNPDTVCLDTLESLDCNKVPDNMAHH